MPVLSIAVLLTLLSCARSFDVVGWWVGTNLTDLERLNWDVYTSVRFGGVLVGPDGTVTGCDPMGGAFAEMLRVTQRHNTTVTLAAITGPCSWKDTNATTMRFCQTFLKTLGPAVRSCGPNIAGMEFDREGDHERILNIATGQAGIVSRAEATWFTRLMDSMQKSMGEEYTVSEDIGMWGFGSVTSHGDAYPFNLLTPWVDAEIIKANPNLFVNTMSYHWRQDCSIKPWQRDATVVNEFWGIPKSQVNLGIGFYSYNHTGIPGEKPWVYHGEPTWSRLSKLCPDIPEDVCECQGIPFTSKRECFLIGQLVKQEGFRGVFPWAANYDTMDPANSLIRYVGLGLGLINKGAVAGTD